MQQLLKKLYEANIQETQAILELAKDYDMLNEQDTLNWLDKLNEISITN